MLDEEGAVRSKGNLLVTSKFLADLTNETAGVMSAKNGKVYSDSTGESSTPYYYIATD